jgi:hypothetical protein
MVASMVFQMADDLDESTVVMKAASRDLNMVASTADVKAGEMVAMLEKRLAVHLAGN